MRTNGDDYLAGKEAAERYVKRHGPTAAETKVEFLRTLAEDSEAYIDGFTIKTRQLARRIRASYVMTSEQRRAIRAHRGNNH